jgi:hypothetical protein
MLVDQPPPPPPIVNCCPSPEPLPVGPFRYRLSVHGRLLSGATLRVDEVAIPTNLSSAPPTPQPSTGSTGSAPATLCYKHGSSRKLCGPVGREWTVILLPGREQYLTLRLGGKTFARVAYRNVKINPPRGLNLATTIRAVGGPSLVGPIHIRVGQQVFFRGPFGPTTLCYKHGSSRLHCGQSHYGGFYVTVRPGRDQYFTARVNGKVVARLIYRNRA